MQDLKLSVSIVTYNQKKFIEQTIESVLQQQVDFDYEIIIGDDCSTDGTREILLNYQEKYPNLIKLILHPQKNEGIPGKANFVSTIYAAKGKYIAMLDGDDYWIDPFKLQKQVDFLEANPDFAICFHPVKTVYENEDREPEITNKNQAAIMTFEDLALNNFIYAVSCVFRNNSLKFPEWFDSMPAGDYPFHLLNAQYGKIGFINEVMAVYRVHKGGFWSTRNLAELNAKWIPIIKECRKQFYPRGEAQFTEQLAKSYQQMCFAYFEMNRYQDFRQNFRACIPLARQIKGRAFLALTIRYFLSHTPRLADWYKNTLTSSKSTLDRST
jgi:glycosyltransferase involved in cell wall biosynthesis